MTLVDTNILLDLVTDDPVWADWSIHGLEAATLRGRLAINDIVFAELSVRFSRVEDVDALVERAGLVMASIPRAALFLAGKVYRRYRASAGGRTGVLPDFLVGAHAAVNGWSLLSRDAQRYRTYFPSVELVCP